MRISSAGQITRNGIKYIIEKLLNNRVGDLLDSYFMKVTDKRWAAKTKKQKRNTRGMVMGLQATKHYSKPDPVNFQYKLLQHYENDLADVIYKYETMSNLHIVSS